ncbi:MULTISPECIES: sensor domain-containing diguanylate cyclase [unclassified Desulfovibrio]|uniref:sensor domain-containing diguanylate cyclase n=1 Tax=unclassified Desulfovibrio TaxID=2593640 RepID=UPI002FDA5DC7
MSINTLRLFLRCGSGGALGKTWDIEYFYCRPMLPVYQLCLYTRLLDNGIRISMDGWDHWLNNVLSFPDGLSERITISSVSKGHIMSTSDPHGTDKSAEEPIPQTSLDVLLWKLDLLETIINELPNPVFAKNSDTRFCFFNKAYESFFSVRREELLNRTVLELDYLSPEERWQYQKEDAEAIRSGGEVHYETSYKTGRGQCSSLYWAKGFVTPGFKQKGLVGVIVDISSQKRLEQELARRVKELEEVRRELRQLSLTDELTTLPNRRLFEMRLQEEVLIANRHNVTISLFMVDIDNFKNINDRFGHDAGDAILRDFAKVLRRTCRESDPVTRFGGDEFIGLLPLACLHDVRTLAERIRKTVKDSCVLPDGRRLTVSIGIAEFQCGESGEQFKKRVDAALYRAKKNGRDQVSE